MANKSVLNKNNDSTSGLKGICERVEALKGRKPEHFAVVTYFVCRVLMILFHEPWFDEALAWLIARDSSLYEILFIAPHYEGHPSLWHLVLMPFAKLDAPYELSLSLVSLIFSGLAMALFIYRSPFKRIIRLLIPFTYFFFYQYSVISRPYSMMLLAFVLMSITYAKRATKPGKFVLTLWFLCLTSAYGIVIAGGVCITWLVEMMGKACKQFENRNSDNGESRNTFRIFCEDYLFANGKFFWLLGLLFYVLFILWRIMPAENAYAVVKNHGGSIENGFIVRLLYTLFVSVSDLFITNVYSVTGTLMYTPLPMMEYIAGLFLGIVIVSLLLCYLKKDSFKLVEFAVPYLFFAVFSSMVYLYDHHIGIILLFAMFILWNTKGTLVSESDYLNKSNPKENGIDLTSSKKIEKKDGIGYLVKSLSSFLLVIMLIVPLYWGVGSAIVDVFYQYGFGRGGYQYLEENGLLDSVFLSEPCRVLSDLDEVEEYSKDSLLLSYEGISIAPYLSKEAKLLNSPAKLGYNYSYAHMLLTKEETADCISNISKMEEPEVLLGLPTVSSVHLGEYNDSDYMMTYTHRIGNIKKAVPGSDMMSISVRRDIVEIKGLDNEE